MAICLNEVSRIGQGWENYSKSVIQLQITICSSPPRELLQCKEEPRSCSNLETMRVKFKFTEQEADTMIEICLKLYYL